MGLASTPRLPWLLRDSLPVFKGAAAAWDEEENPRFVELAEDLVLIWFRPSEDGWIGGGEGSPSSSL